MDRNLFSSLIATLLLVGPTLGCNNPSAGAKAGESGTTDESEDTGEDGEGATPASYEGIFQVTRTTIAQPCEGGETFDTTAETLDWVGGYAVGMSTRGAFGYYICADVEQCDGFLRDAAAGDPVAANWVFPANEEIEGVRRGETQWSGWSEDDGSCVDPELVVSTARLQDDGSVELEIDHHFGAPYPQDSGGYCTTEGAEAACAGAPCGSREVWTLVPIVGR
jgi:hypothetical protein